MKKLMFALAIALCSTQISIAQTDAVPAPVEKIEKKDKTLKKEKKQAKAAAAKELGLSAEQKEKMKDIAAAAKGKIQAIRTDDALSKEEKKERMKTIMSENESEIKAILSPEQQVIWEENKAEKRAKMKEQRKNK
jgi:Spy/CpxP family protein refolding chaperone